MKKKDTYAFYVLVSTVSSKNGRVTPCNFVIHFANVTPLGNRGGHGGHCDKGSSTQAYTKQGGLILRPGIRPPLPGSTETTQPMH